jgi:hypothetical protein
MNLSEKNDTTNRLFVSFNITSYIYNIMWLFYDVSLNFCSTLHEITLNFNDNDQETSKLSFFICAAAYIIMCSSDEMVK